MERRDLTRRVLLTAAGAGALAGRAEAQTCNPPCYAQSRTEVVAGVVPVNTTFPEGDVRRYGAVAVIGSDPRPVNDVALNNAALTQAVLWASVQGGVIRFPAGALYFSSFPSLDQKSSIVFEGVSTTDAGLPRGSVLWFTGVGTGVVVSMLSAAGVVFRNLQLGHTDASFTGTYFKLGNNGNGDCVFSGFFDCYLGDSSGTGVVHLDLDRSHSINIQRCAFVGGNPSIRGQFVSGTSYSNVIRFRDCYWRGAKTGPIVWGGDAWTFDGCTFEALASGVAGAFSYGSAGVISHGLAFRSCWFGDVTVAGGTWLSLNGSGIEISGCEFGGNASTTWAVSLNSCKGVRISGNNFDTFTVAVAFRDANCSGVTFTENNLSAVQTVFLNPNLAPLDLVFNPNSPPVVPPTGLGQLAAIGYEISANKVVRQWGFSVVTVGVAKAISFPRVFPTGVWNLQLSTSLPSSTAVSSAYSTALTSSGFTANLAGTAGATATVYWHASGN